MEPHAAEEIKPLNSIDKELFDDISKILPKPTCEWTENDFPDLPGRADNALNRFLHAYSRFLNRFITSLCGAEDRDTAEASLSQGSTLGLLLKVGILVGDVAFVAYAVEVRRLQTEADVTLLWISTIFWLILLWLILKHLEVLGKERGGCFERFVCLEDRWSKVWRASCAGVKHSWEKVIVRCSPSSQNMLLFKKKIRKS